MSIARLSHPHPSMTAGTTYSSIFLKPSTVTPLSIALSMATISACRVAWIRLTRAGVGLLSCADYKNDLTIGKDQGRKGALQTYVACRIDFVIPDPHNAVAVLTIHQHASHGHLLVPQRLLRLRARSATSTPASISESHTRTGNSSWSHPPLICMTGPPAARPGP